MISYSDLKKLPVIEKVIVHSLEQALYQVSVLIDGEEKIVMDKRGRAIRANSVLELESMFEAFNITQVVMRHESPYDEMIGQPVRQGSNRIEVPIGRNQLGRKPKQIH